MNHRDIFAKFIDVFYEDYKGMVLSYAPAGKDTVSVYLKTGGSLRVKYVDDAWTITEIEGE